MSEIRNDRRPNGTTAPRSDPTTTFENAVQTFGLGALLRLPSELHDVLATESRREILAYLYGIDREVAIAELADYLATAGIETDRGRATMALEHAHLPKLDGTGLIRWDRENGTVRLSVADGDQN